MNCGCRGYRHGTVSTTGNCTDSVAATTICLSDAQIRAEIQRLYAAGALGPVNANTTYFVFTARNVGSCYNSSSCAFSSYCAYHSNVSLGGVTVQYANQPTRTRQHGLRRRVPPEQQRR